jgi:hypothetical protein
VKKLLLLFIFSSIFLSCEKDYLIPEREVPEWLKARINQDEQKIKDSPKSMCSYGAWLRYKWQNDYYFEYYNMLSSSSPIAVSFDRDTLHIMPNDMNTDYCKEKCCKRYVWKAPHYIE